jgi:hypothetical protein
MCFPRFGQINCIPLDFLWSWSALAKFMRLSLMKAAHAIASA